MEEDKTKIDFTDNDETQHLEESTDNTQNDKKLSRRKFIVISSLSVLSMIPLGIGTAYVVSPKIAESEAQDNLDLLKSKKGPITPMNTEPTTFSGQLIENADVNQKALKGSTTYNAAVFIFGNGKSVEQKTLDLYIDFDSQLSRDFFLINQDSFSAMIKNGVIQLHIHPVASGSALSMYSPEAIAESFVSTPNRAWDFMIALLKLSANIQNSGNKDILSSVEKTAQENKINNVTAETVSQGTYSSWILAVGDDEKLKTGYYPPIAYVNGEIIDSETVEFNDVDSFRQAILSKGNS